MPVKASTVIHTVMQERSIFRAIKTPHLLLTFMNVGLGVGHIHSFTFATFFWGVCQVNCN